MKASKYVLFGILAITLLLMACEKEQVYVTSFEECVEAGNGVMDSMPEQCVHKGKTFINEEQNKEPGKFNSCNVDADCIPLPYQCHPTSCVNKEYKDLFTFDEPMACTAIFISSAAYTPEDCICQQNYCVNKNLNNEEPIMQVTNFEECVAAGNAVMESFPEQCIHEGQLFIKEINFEELELPEDKYEACEAMQGTPLPEFNECEWISEEACTYLEGEYQDCASACRNNPNEEMCIMMCVQVCAFN
jgi:hypothetical protein